MAEPETADEKKAATKRLAFDSENSDNDIPQFLKKGQPKKVEPEEEENNPDDLETEATDPISEGDSSSESMENEEMDQVVNKQAKPAKLGVPKSFSDLAAEMTIDQLRKQQEEIDRRIKEKQSAEKQAVIDQIVSVVTEYNIPVEELVEALGGTKNRRKGSKAKAKYRDPASGVTWSGRGKEPSWIKGAADRTPFEI
jgi:DNA-binding protein H-NS